MNILIVDDIAENIFSLHTLIENEFNINVFSALNANDAIEILMKEHIDLILSDIQMPDIDGFEFANYIRGIEKFKNIPLIFITAIYNKDEYKLRGYNLDAIDYITKPIDTKILISKLSKYIEIFQVKNELEKENKHVKRLLNAQGISYILTDPNIKNNPVVFVNDYFCTLTGYSKEEVLGKNLNLLKVDDSDEDERKKIKKAMEEKIPVTVILKNKKKNGEIFFNKISISPIFDDEINEIEYFVGMQSDITNIVKEKKFSEAILNTSQSIILLTDGKELKKINKRFFDIFDYKNMDDFKSKHKCICELFITKENKNYLQPEVNGIPWNKFIILDSKIIYESCMIDKNGEERIFQVESTGEFLDNEEKEQVITLTDITLLMSHKEMLVEQSKFVAMGEMISMIAHQWRQPLTTLTLILDKMNILNQFKQLDGNKFTEQYSKSINLIQYMSKTINDFRHFFHEKDNKEKILLEELIYQSYELIAPALNKESVTSKILIDNDCQDLIVKLNTSKISQVFLNLYKNALDEIKSKKIENPIIQTTCYKTKEYLIIKISDNAGGIPEHIINKIFEPYFSTKSKNGTGLGLYMSKIIIEQQLNGLINVENENNGACFKIMLPFNLIV